MRTLIARIGYNITNGLGNIGRRMEQGSCKDWYSPVAQKLQIWMDWGVNGLGQVGGSQRTSLLGLSCG
jgi:hypothetical protein